MLFGKKNCSSFCYCIATVDLSQCSYHLHTYIYIHTYIHTVANSGLELVAIVSFRWHRWCTEVVPGMATQVQRTENRKVRLCHSSAHRHRAHQVILSRGVCLLGSAAGRIRNICLHQAGMDYADAIQLSRAESHFIVQRIIYYAYIYLVFWGPRSF